MSEHIIIEIECKGKSVVVKRDHRFDGVDYYHVYVDGEDKHGLCFDEDVMRALANYAHDDSVTGVEPKLNRDNYEGNAYDYAMTKIDEAMSLLNAMNKDELRIIKFRLKGI